LKNLNLIGVKLPKFLLGIIMKIVK